jgi:ClpP class serine protease
MICLGADEIVMTPLGALGPIDPSRTHPLLPKGGKKRRGSAEWL